MDIDTTTTRPRRRSIRGRLAAAVLGALALLGGLALPAAPADAASLWTAVVTSANTGSASASITLYRYDASGWTVEKSGRTNASGGVTFLGIRGNAYYQWVTVKGAVRFNANGTTSPCHFYTRSTPSGTLVRPGYRVNVPMYDYWNTCGY